MQTNLADFIKDTPEGREADAILRTCVHCGFCLATCPTYQLLGDELDSPRGRIYLMKQVLEGATPTRKTQLHLDRCLTCRACETTCPSGVQYGRLVDIGRYIVDTRVRRDGLSEGKRSVLLNVIPNRALFGGLLALGRSVRPLLPEPLKGKVPVAQASGPWPPARHARRMIVLDGCVQPSMAPNINSAAARVLDRLGISLIPVAQAGCCGALAHHLNAHAQALDQVRRNIDAWWPEIERGAEAIVVTASGCGTMVKDYGYLLQRDTGYAEKAARVSSLFRDLSTVVAQEKARLRTGYAKGRRIAVHSPCTLQHGLKVRGVVEALLADAGFTLTPVPDSHLCCGSSGTYSILQPELSLQLRANKVKALESGAPEEIVTANIGCLAHLAGGTQRPVRHWVELIADGLRED
jgi:glycolate dehydrogenase iron-sulfur subunit